MAEPSLFQKITRKLEETPIGAFKTAKNAKIIDWKLGLMYHALTGVAVGYGIFVIRSAYQSSEAIGDAGVSFYFGGQADMVAATDYSVDDPAAVPSYCNNADYNYNYCWQCTGACADGWVREDPTCETDNWWDDTNIDCRAFPYGEVGQKFNDQGFVQTFNKITSYKEALCADANFTTLCPAVTAGQRQWTQRTMTEFGELCTCKTTQDYFVIGAEELALSFEHGFTTSSILDHDGLSWKGRSSYPKSDMNAGTKAIETTLYKNCEPGAMWHEHDTEDAWFGPCDKVEKFKPGEEVYASVRKWLEMADVDLDESVPSGSVTGDARGSAAGMPRRRSVGVNLAIILEYTGFTDNSENFKCAVRVEALSDSWASQSSKLMYDVQRSVVPGTSSRAEYIDTYSRGIKFTFVTRGLIYKFDFQTALDGFIQALLLGLAAVPFLMGLLAFNNPFDPRAKVYNKYCNEKFDIERMLAQYGMSAMHITQFCRAVDRDHDGTTLSYNEMTSLLTTLCGGDADTSRQIAHFLMKESNEHDPTSDADASTVSVRELVELMTSDWLDFDELKEAAAKHYASLGYPEANPGRPNRAAQVHVDNEEPVLEVQNFDGGGSMRTFAVVVPPGAMPGASFQVAAPNGQVMVVTVPPGAMSGTTLDLEY